MRIKNKKLRTWKLFGVSSIGPHLLFLGLYSHSFNHMRNQESSLSKEELQEHSMITSYTMEL